MKIHPLRNRRGVALVVVLVFLVLLSIFIVGFFSNSQDELNAAQSFTGEVSASHLAESAVSVVMGQIREATSRTNGAWGSQPGMIRVYRDGKNASDKADAFFKLYSSDDMIVSGAEIAQFDPAKEVAEGAGVGWQHVPALWTNLNEEVKVPIPNSDKTVDRYPILDPSLDRQVEGLEFLDNVSNAEASSKLKKARMPVKWLYVLKDGTLTAPSTFGANGTQANWKKGEREPTIANPIVGRVAFWTDDESCKVNINTAGGYTFRPEDSVDDGGMPTKDKGGKAIGEDEYAGSFWDTPRAFTLFDRGEVEKNADSRSGSKGELQRGGLALSQPARGEFQRYPGHPATTSLGIVFRGRPPNAAGTMQDAPYLFKSGQLALLAPRLMFSRTNRNERATNYGTSRLIGTDLRNDPDVEVQSNDLPISPRVKRLYASVDELFYAQPDKPPGPQRKQNDWELGVTGVSQNDNAKILTADYLEKMRFFLTAHSRAPEVNLFGQPRVTIWPVFEVTTSRREDEWWNASDRLIAFCSTIGPDASKVGQENVLRYLFQRVDAYSPTADISLKRNQAILRYLRNITSKPFPGFGGQSFEQKYQDAKFGGDPFGREQILVEIFDYIRTVNLRDSTRDKKINDTVKPLNGLANIQKKEQYKYAPRGLVVPAISTNHGTGLNERHGFGRFPTISEASIVLYCSGFIGSDGKRYLNSRQDSSDVYSTRWVLNRDGNFVDNAGKVLPPTAPKSSRVFVKQSLVRAFFITETFNPMQGYAPTTTPNGNSVQKGSIVFEIENLDQFTLDGKPLAMPAKKKKDTIDPNVTNEVAFASGNLWGGRNSGGSEGFMHTMWTWPASRPKNGVNPIRQGLGGGIWYPYQTDPTVAGVADPSGIVGVPFDYQSAIGQPVKTTGVLQGPGELKLKMFYSKDLKKPVRDIVLNFGGQVVIPMPTDEVWSAPYTGTDPNLIGTYGARATKALMGGLPYGTFSFDVSHRGGFVADPNRPSGTAGWSCNIGFKFYSLPGSNPPPGDLFYPKDRTAKSLGDWYDDAEPFVDKKIKPGRLTWIQNDSNNHSGDTTPGPDYERRWMQILQPGDIVRSVVYGSTDPTTMGLGDLRKSCIAVDSGSASTVFFKHPEYADPTVRHAQTLRLADSQLYYPDHPGDSTRGETKFGNVARLQNNRFYPAAQSADLPRGINGVKRIDGKTGDFDTGIGNLADGPFCNKADEGNLAFQQKYFVPNTNPPVLNYILYPTPYFTWSYEEAFDTFFSPNRQVPSPVVFGSLLSGKGADWQTLCFSPNPAGNTAGTGPESDNHPGRSGTKDYLWLDLFTMPVVEPYAISEPFSTAGKINLNYPIVPFTHIKRTTGLRAALQPVRVTGFPVTDVSTFKTGVNGKPVDGINYRYLVDRDETIKGFDDFFGEYTADHSKGFIKAGAQICDFYLYPRRGGKAVVTWVKGDTKIKQWWNQNTLTGDNVREKPYADLYPRITTKSNTFCVHVRAQSLRQSAASDPKNAEAHYRTWDEKRDRVVGEYRGSSIIERYIDPQDERFDVTSQNKGVVGINPDTTSIDQAYRFRVLNTKRFDP